MDNQNKKRDIAYYTKRNGFLRELFRQLKEKGVETLEQFLKIMDTNEATFFSERKGFPLDRNKPFKWHPVRIDTIRKLYLPFSIDCENFLLDRKTEDEFFTLKSRNSEKHLYFTNNYWDKVKDYKQHFSLKKVIPFSTGRYRNLDLQSAYKEVVSRMMYAKEKIIIYELLFKGDNLNPGYMKAYMTAQNEVFNGIESALKTNKNKKFLYKRILSVSQSQKFFQKSTIEELKIAMVTEASTNTLKHILWCWENYPDSCQFRVAKTSRFRHHAIIDNTWFLTEDYIIDQNEVVIPDCLFINDIHRPSPIDEFKDLYEEHINLQKTITLRRGDINRYLRKAYKVTKNNIEKKELLIKWLEQNPQEDREELLELMDRIKDELELFESLLKNLNRKILILGYILY